MKKLYALLFGLAALLAACDNDDDKSPEYITFGFEQGTAGSLAGPTAYGDNLYTAASWTPYDPSKFGNGADYPAFTSFHDPATGLSFGLPGTGGFEQGGVAISQWHDKTDGSFDNQCSVYGDGGNGGSKTFGIVYAALDQPKPTISFKTPADGREIESLWITNSTTTVWVMENGNQFTNGTLEGQNGWLMLTIEGFGADGASTGKEDFYLADFRESTAAKGIVKEWTKIDLSRLGKVRRLEFSVDGSDKSGKWLNTPSYFCIDDIKVKAGE